MSGAIITLLFLAAIVVLTYRRLGLLAFCCTLTVLVAVYCFLAPPAPTWKSLLWMFTAALWLLNLKPLRRALISGPFLKSYRRLLPSMSQTEKEALEAGTVWWDGELFTGAPRWEKLQRARAPALTAAEQAFLDGPCETLCAMLDDWDITHVRADLPPPVWSYLTAQGFFAMIIPKAYGGLEFSAYAHSCVLAKIAQPQHHLLLHRCGPELTGSGRAAQSLRHPGAEGPLPAAACPWG
ncbi:MAG: acyl-CoA dehydrogenase family protein [Steroidobacteraceae bacterium]